MRARVAGLLAIATIVVSASPVLAIGVVQVPEPSTLSLVAVGAAVVAIGSRWIRRG